jgi:hypothetical protein
MIVLILIFCVAIRWIGGKRARQLIATNAGKWSIWLRSWGSGLGWTFAFGIFPLAILFFLAADGDGRAAGQRIGALMGTWLLGAMFAADAPIWFIKRKQSPPSSGLVTFGGLLILMLLFAIWVGSYSVFGFANKHQRRDVSTDISELGEKVRQEKAPNPLPSITWWQAFQAKINLWRGERWGLPIHIGDTREHVYEVLGNPARSSDSNIASCI